MLTLKGTSPVAILAGLVCPTGIKPLVHTFSGAPVGNPNMTGTETVNNSQVTSKNF